MANYQSFEVSSRLNSFSNTEPVSKCRQTEQIDERKENRALESLIRTRPDNCLLSRALDKYVLLN